MKKLTLFCSLTLLTVLPVKANVGEIKDDILQCKLIASAVTRLDCYDQLAEELTTQQAAVSEPAEEQVIAQPAAANPTAQKETDDFGKASRDNDDDKRYMSVVEMWQSPHGAWRFRFDNGQEWHQTQVDTRFPVEEGRRYYIKRGSFNSFRMSHDETNRTTRVKRVN